MRRPGAGPGRGGQHPAGGTSSPLSSGADDLSTQTLTVVGFVTDPLYFSTETESTTAGNGALGLAAYVADGSLTMDYYTTCYIKAATLR